MKTGLEIAKHLLKELCQVENSVRNNASRERCVEATAKGVRLLKALSRKSAKIDEIYAKLVLLDIFGL